MRQDDSAKVLADPRAYADEPKLHAALAHLRANAPVTWVEAAPYRPFWAITKHADVMAIERANTIFTNSPRPVLMTAEADELQASVGVSKLINMDDPQHRVVRAIGADWFRPKAMRALKVRVDELAKKYVDKMLAAGTECDFVQEVAVNYPLYVIMSLLGLPESDFPRMLQLTQELFGNDDDEFQRGTSSEDNMAALLDMFAYFNALTGRGASALKHITLGKLDVSRIGLGAMSMSGYYNTGQGSDAESIRTIHRALELGVTHLDTAEIYGPFLNEELVGRAIKGRRDQVVVATKFGLVSHSGGGPGVVDSTPANVRAALEGSLKRLGTDYVDLYYQHRVDPNTRSRTPSGLWPSW